MANMNPNCCGDKCRSATGEVRLYPLGGGGNLIICRACWDHENDYRRTKGQYYRRPQDWPEHDWNTAEVCTYWSGSPDPADPANFWIDDDTDERVNAVTGERTRVS